MYMCIYIGVYESGPVCARGWVSKESFFFIFSIFGRCQIF